MVKYIATRDGVEKMPSHEKNLPPTLAQQKLISQILHDLHETVNMFEYADYLTKQNKESASEFISCAIDNHLDLVGKRKNYVNYIANRPRVQKIGNHGLFSSTDDPIIISKVEDEVSNHTGNVWTNIISIRREDAMRLGYDNAKMWMALLRSHAMEIAENMKISPENLKWYGAFHNETYHPHVHLIIYSTNPNEAYLTDLGIENIRASLAKDIFRQDLMQIYTEQTKQRDTLTSESKNFMQDIVFQVENGIIKNEKIEQLLTELSRRLKNTDGKKVYGYLKADLKIIVDNIVDEMSNDERLKQLYDLWNEQRYAVLKTYTDTLPSKQPLSKQKEFKCIKNMVIAEALKLSDHYFTFKEVKLQRTELEPYINEDRAYHYSEKTKNKKTNSMPKTVTHNLQTIGAVASLFQNCTRVLTNQINIESKPDQQIDRKLLRQIEEKKQANGIRI